MQNWNVMGNQYWENEKWMDGERISSMTVYIHVCVCVCVYLQHDIRDTEYWNVIPAVRSRMIYDSFVLPSLYCMHVSVSAVPTGYCHELSWKDSDSGYGFCN
jgi:hypothetical protein